MLKILVVDDEGPARRRMHDLLADLAGEVPHVVVGEAPNGVEALALVGELGANLVFADMQMPRMSGIELAQHLARLEAPPAVVFVTARR